MSSKPTDLKMRRKLLKTSLSAPVIMTLQAGPASAALTSATACFKKDDQLALDLLRGNELVSIEDRWLRLPVEIVKLFSGSGTTRVELPDLYFLGKTGYYWRLQESGGQITSATQTTYFKDDPTAPRPQSLSPQQIRYAVAYVDPDRGLLLGYAFERLGGQPSSVSCWSSLYPNTKLQNTRSGIRRI